jgi:hypothetical protein
MERILICGMVVVHMYILAACQALEPKRADSNRQPAVGPGSEISSEMMLVKYWVPALNQIKTIRGGDATGVITHYAHRLEASDPSCISAQTKTVLNYVGAREERILVPRLCRMRLSIALGQMSNTSVGPAQPTGGPAGTFTVIYETQQLAEIGPQVWLNGREALINYVLVRSTLGQTLGMAQAEVQVFFPGGTSSLPGPTPSWNPAPTFNPQPAPTGVPTVQPNPNAQVVEFRIKPGTGSAAWNDASTAVGLKIGQTLRIINDDSVVHQLHTDGAPCPHGTPIRPGASFDCAVRRAFPGPSLYDHISNGRFFLNAN